MAKKGITVKLKKQRPSSDASPNPFGNRAERRKAKKLGIKPEHMIKDENAY